MKKTLFFILGFCAIVLSSCNANEDITEVKTEEFSISESQMDGYKSVVYNNRELLSEWGLENQEAQLGSTRAAQLESEKFQELKDSLLPSAIQFAEDLQLTNSDIEEALGERLNNKEDYENAVLGIMLFSAMSNFCVIPQTRGGGVVDCFIEATGIAAGAGVVGALTAGTMTKATLKAAIKLAAKVGGRTLSGIGLGLIAAEMAWCMW